MQKNNVYSMLIEKANKDFGIPEQFAKGQLRNSVWSSLWAMVSYADIVDVIMGHGIIRGYCGHNHVRFAPAVGKTASANRKV